MSMGFLAFIGIGCLVGFRHAFEPDHLAAVAMLATRERGWRGSAALGLAWGIGHTVSVAAVAVLIIVLGIKVPAGFYSVCELLIAAMLIALGLATLIADARRHRHALGPAHEHAHVGHAGHVHTSQIRSVRGALGFGLAHGLAGSGAVIVLLVAAATGVREQFAYLVAFGAGTVGGMSLVSLLVMRVSGRAVARGGNWARTIRVSAAALSLVVGVLLGWSVIAAA
jgi:hypothetical protein